MSLWRNPKDRFCHVKAHNYVGIIEILKVLKKSVKNPKEKDI